MVFTITLRNKYHAMLNRLMLYFTKVLCCPSFFQGAERPLYFILSLRIYQSNVKVIDLIINISIQIFRLNMPML